MELGYKIKDVIKVIKKEKPRIIGVSSLTLTYLNALSLLKTIKYKFPKIITLIGGLHISKNPQDAIKRNFADFELIGEAENTIIDLMKYIINGTKKLSEIPGLIYNKDGIIQQNEGFPIIENLDELPYPAIDLVKQNRYFISFQKYKRSTIIMGSRGCPFKCIFCDKLTNKIRLRTPEGVVREIRYFYHKFKIRDFQFYDLTFNINNEWVKNLCKLLIKENLPIVWRCSARVELINEETIKLMKDAGCYLIAFGVESGNNASLKFLNKGFTVRDIISAFRLTKKYKIETHAYFIVGIPGETKNIFLNTIKLIKSISPDYVNSLTLRPFPNTKLAEISIEKGWFNFSDNDIFSRDFKYQSNLTLKLPDIKARDILKMQKLGIRAYFFNIKYLGNLLIKFIKEPQRFVINIWQSIKELFKVI